MDDTGPDTELDRLRRSVRMLKAENRRLRDALPGAGRTDGAEAEAALRASEERYRTLFEQVGVGVGHAGLDGTWLLVNDRFAEILGYTRAELTGRTFQEVTHPDDLPEDLVLVRALDAGEIPHVSREKRYIRKDGSPVWVQITVSVVRHPSGEPKHRVVVVQDINDRRLAQETLRRTAKRLRLSLDAAAMGEWDCDFTTGRFVLSPQYRELFGFTPDEPLTLDMLRARYHPEDAARVRALTGAGVDGSGPFMEQELRIVRPDGAICWLALRGEFFPGPDGRIIRATGVMSDITERKRAEEAARVLVDELSHRVKNTLATVQAIADHMLRDGRGRDFGEVFRGRLHALAHAHKLLSDTNWAGADLRALAEIELAPYGDDRMVVEGPSILLPPRIAQTLGLVLHELATNAAKHGALAGHGGIHLSWRVEPAADGPTLRIDWDETGGRPARRPGRKGFGSILIERSVGYELDGTVDVSYRTDGLTCRIAVPLRAD